MIDEYDYRLVIRRDRLGDAKRSRGSTVMIDVLVVARIACQAFGVQLIVYSRSYSPGITAEIIGNIRKRKWPAARSAALRLQGTARRDQVVVHVIQNLARCFIRGITR